MNGKLLQKTISSSSEALSSDKARYLLIFLAGATAMVLHETFRFGLGLPGRQGLTLMAILIFVRCAAPYQFTATLAGSGGLVAAFIFRDNPTAATIVMMQGILLDLAYKQLSSSSITLWLLPIAAGLIHTVKPLFKLGLFLWAGVEAGAFRNGIWYPFITHFIFGATGGLIGFMAWRALKKKSQ